MNTGFAADLEFSRFLLGDAGNGPNLSEVEDVEEFLGGVDGLAEAHMAFGDDSGARCVEGDGGWRVAGLTALNLHDGVSFFDKVTGNDVELGDVTGDAAGDDGVVAWDFLESSDDEEGAFKGDVLGFHDFDAEVSCGAFAEVDALFFIFSEEWKGEEEGKDETFHWAVAVR